MDGRPGAPSPPHGAPITLTQQSPTPDSQTRRDDDLDDLLGDNPVGMPEESAAAGSTPGDRPVANENPVPMEQVDAMLADRVEDGEEASIDDLLGDDERTHGPEAADTGAPPELTGATAFPEVPPRPPLVPAPEEMAEAKGADAVAVAFELDAEEAEQKIASVPETPKHTRGVAVEAMGTVLPPQGIVERLRRTCAAINRPTAHLPPDLRNLVGYAGLVTIFLATLLVVGKIFWVLIFEA